MMTSFRRMGFLGGAALVSLVTAVGCRDPIFDADDGASSGGAPATGGATPDASGGAGGEGGAGGAGGVGGAHSACHEVVDAALGDGCDNSRVCNYEIADAYCDAGNGDATQAFVACFRHDGRCHTPADPGNDDVRDCFADVIEEHGTAASAAVRAAADEVCDDYRPLKTEVFAVMAGADKAATIQTCVETAATCDAVTACLNANFGIDMPASCL